MRLHSRFHELWSLRLCTWLGQGNDPRYTPSSTFETFPFPAGLAPDVPAADYARDPRAAAIADAAERLVALRDRFWTPALTVIGSMAAVGTIIVSAFGTPSGTILGSYFGGRTANPPPSP